jgi:hypothetical protein
MVKLAAASTNIVIKGNTWIVSGGMKARVFYSADKGYWEVYDTPIVQGKGLAFYC